MKRAKQEGVEALKHRAPPGAQARLSEEQRAVGFEGELLFSIYLSVLEIVGTGRDDLLGLLF